MEEKEGGRGRKKIRRDEGMEEEREEKRKKVKEGKE